MENLCCCENAGTAANVAESRIKKVIVFFIMSTKLAGSNGMCPEI